MLELRGVHFAYKTHSPVTQDVSLTINSGEFVAVVGRNGSGKTTLTRLMMALKKPTSGQILFNGKNTEKLSPADMARHIGYVFQNPDRQIFRDTVMSEVAYGPEQLGYPPSQIKDFIIAALEATGLSQLAEAYPPSLSKGQKQRLAIASALAMQPQMLILDEPTSGQDAVEREQLLQLLAKLNHQGKTILLITHDMDLLARYTKRVIVMAQGTKVFDGSVRQLFSDVALLKQWGLTEPVAVKLSRELGYLGIEQTDSIQQLGTCLSKLIGRNPHAESSATH